MATKILCDIDFDSVGKIINLPDAVNDGDAVSKKFLEKAQTLDFMSGISEISEDESFIIKNKRQSTTFCMLTLDGELTLDGDLWLA